MDVNFLKSSVASHLYDSQKMIHMGVNAAIGHQAHDMQRAAFIQRILHGFLHSRDIEKFAIFNGLGHPGQRLIHHSPSTQV